MVYADPKTGREAAIVMKAIVKRRGGFILLIVLFLKRAYMEGDADVALGLRIMRCAGSSWLRKRC